MLNESYEIEDIKRISESNIDFYKLKGKTILISGGTGFIGTYLIDVLKYRNKHFGDNIKIISLSRTIDYSNDDVEYVKCDVSNEIFLDKKVDFVIHLASNTHPKQYEEDPVGTITTNVLGCNNLLKFCVKNNCQRFLLASSVEIYGECIDMPINEMYSGYINCNNARSGYNESKRLCESLCQSYKKQYGIDFVTARFARIIGPDKKNDTKAISQFIDKALLNEDIILKSNGNQMFSFCYVTDAVSAILTILTNGKNGEAYNVSADNEFLSLYEYACIIAQFSGKKVIKKIENNDYVSKTQFALLDNNKIKDIGWIPYYTIREGLKRTFEIKKAYKTLK